MRGHPEASSLDFAPDETLDETHGSPPCVPVDAPGKLFGRYEITELLGHGTSGAVHGAHDPALDRKVAIKSLHPELVSESHAARIRAEAVALAQLHHPNVVPIYDVGEADGTTFIVMEKIHGQTLRVWMGEPHTWQEIVALFIEAGEGLAAAHSLGLVHRDFKPENVLVDERGRPRVVDFGLVRGIGPVSQSGSDVTNNTAEKTGDRLTHTGRTAGTPAYMPPEQFKGRALDARADQFSFCVALFEALEGHRPFRGETLGAMVRSMLRTNRRTLGRSSPQPRRLRAALRRGLAVRPDDRFPSMRELLDALRRIDKPSNRGWLLLPLAAAGVLVLNPFDAEVNGSPTTGPVTQPASAVPSRAFASALDQGRAQERNGDHESALASAARALALSDLDEQRAQVHVLRARALFGSRRLSAARAAAQRAYALADADADAVTMVRAAVLTIRASTAGEQTRDGLDWFRRAEAQVQRANLPPLERSRLALAEALVHANQGEYPAALEAVERGMSLASGAEAWRARTDLLVERAIVLRDMNQHAEAVSEIEAARDARRSGLGDGHPDTLYATALLSEALSGAGQAERALVEAQEAVARLDDWDDASKSARVRLLMALSQALYGAGRYDEALASADQTRRVAQEGDETWRQYEAGIYRLELAVNVGLERWPEALRAAQSLVDRSTELQGPDAELTLDSRLNLAEIQLRLGGLSEAEAALRDVRDRAKADELRTDADRLLAEVAIQQGQFERACILLTAVVTNLEQTDDVGFRGLARMKFARALHGAKRPPEAADQIRKAHADLLAAGPEWWKEQREAQKLATRLGLAL